MTLETKYEKVQMVPRPIGTQSYTISIFKNLHEKSGMSLSISSHKLHTVRQLCDAD